MILRTERENGFTLIELMLVCTILGILSAMAVPRLLMARQAADSSSAIGSLRAVNSSEVGYAASCGSGFYAPDFPTLGVPSPGSSVTFISVDLSGGATVLKSGYLFQLTGTASPDAPATCNGLARGVAASAFKVGADPVDPINTRYFASNPSSTIFEDSMSLFATMPEVGAPASGHPLN